MYIRQLGTFLFLRIYISNNNVGYNKAEGEEQEDGRSLYSVELFAHFDTDCSTHPYYVCSCINDDNDGEDIEDVNDKVDEMYCYKMTLKILIPTMTTIRTTRSTRRTRRRTRREERVYCYCHYHCYERRRLERERGRERDRLVMVGKR